MWRLPWNERTVPHAVLDFVRGCNVSCRSCYNTAPPAMKTLQEVRAELELLVALRRLHSISILGGEPTLHPELPAIVRLVRQRGLHVELFTNGLLLDEALAGTLADAGVDAIALHVERGQQRSDLPDGDIPAVLRLLEEKAALVARRGMQAGMCLTLERDSMADVPQVMRAFLESPSLTFCVLTLHMDPNRITSVKGDLASGLRGTRDEGLPANEQSVPLEDVREILEAGLHLEPFAYIGSNLDATDPRWLSYLAATSLSPDGVQCSTVRPGLVEPLFMAASRLLTGVYPFYQAPSRGKTLAHLLANALTGGRALPGLSLFARGVLGVPVVFKRILIQRPAEVEEDGRVRHCANCPDATLLDGRLVPVCLRDRVVARVHEATSGLARSQRKACGAGRHDRTKNVLEASDRRGDGGPRARGRTVSRQHVFPACGTGFSARMGQAAQLRKCSQRALYRLVGEDYGRAAAVRAMQEVPCESS